MTLALLAVLVWTNYVIRRDNLSFDATRSSVSTLEGKISDVLLISDQEQSAERVSLNIMYNEEKHLHDAPTEELESIANKGFDALASLESCADLGGLTLVQDVDRSVELYNYKLYNRGVNTYERRRLQDQELDNLYAEMDTSRTNFYLTMEYKQQFYLYVDGFKQFVSANDQLAQARQTAVGAEVNEFRELVDIYIKDRDDRVMDSINALRSSIGIALAEAGVTCNQPTDHIDSASLLTSVLMARAEYLSAIRDLNLYSEQIDIRAESLLEAVKLINAADQKQAQALQADFAYIKPEN